MPLFNSKPQRDGLEGILHVISIGECDDYTLKRLESLVAGMSDDDVKSLADTLMTNLVRYPDNVSVLIGSIAALETLPFLPKAKNEFIITLLLSLLNSPASHKDLLQRKMLKEKVIKFLLIFVSKDDGYAKLMMSELITALGDTYGGVSASVFHVLQWLAAERPEYFESYSASLIKQLGSINKSTRAESAKIIGIIARSHPEYVYKAMPFLQSLASFYPDAHVKQNANEAYQIMQRTIKQEPDPHAARKEAPEGKGLADLMKLNAGMQNSRAPAQFTDAELKEIIDLTRKEFKSDAESILDSLGVGHLSVKGRENRARQDATVQKETAAKTAPLEAVMTKKAVPPPGKPLKMEKSNPAVLEYKCPKCGRSMWTKGQLCNDCASAEFDSKVVRGHYDIRQ